MKRRRSSSRALGAFARANAVRHAAVGALWVLGTLAVAVLAAFVGAVGRMKGWW